MQAAIVRMEAMENIQLLLMFLMPCLRTYQIVLGLMVSAPPSHR